MVLLACCGGDGGGGGGGGLSVCLFVCVVWSVLLEVICLSSVLSMKMPLRDVLHSYIDRWVGLLSLCLCVCVCF